MELKKKKEKVLLIYRTLPPLLLEGSILSQVGLNALSSVDHKVLLTNQLLLLPCLLFFNNEIEVPYLISYD